MRIISYLTEEKEYGPFSWLPSSRNNVFETGKFLCDDDDDDDEDFEDPSDEDILDYMFPDPDARSEFDEDGIDFDD